MPPEYAGTSAAPPPALNHYTRIETTAGQLPPVASPVEHGMQALNAMHQQIDGLVEQLQQRLAQGGVLQDLPTESLENVPLPPASCPLVGQIASQIKHLDCVVRSLHSLLQQLAL